MDISPQQLQLAGIYLVCLVISIGVHEYFHALVAHRLGDATPEGEGRLTLNPLAHADPVGTFALPLIAAFTAMPLLGWGRPVNTQPRNYTRKVSMRTGMAIVAAAGPFGNLVVAMIALGLAGVLNLAGVLSPQIAQVLLILIGLNVLLMVFNLIPLHPLDGGKILAAFLPPRFEHIDEFLQRYGPYMLIALVVVGGGVLSTLVAPFDQLTKVAWSIVVPNQ